MSVMPKQVVSVDPGLETSQDDSLVFAAASIVKEMSSSMLSRPVREVVSNSRSFRLEGHRLHTATEATGPIVLVFVKDLPEQLPEDVELRSRFGFTRKEACVARLIAEDLTNEQIAAELSISPHTARHHTERVLAKLGLRTRLRVRAALLGQVENS
jgi:DNA-binding CsgD family transcriptional regulator